MHMFAGGIKLCLNKLLFKFKKKTYYPIILYKHLCMIFRVEV